VLLLLLLLLQELGESTGQLKQLVKQNFERFIRWVLGGRGEGPSQRSVQLTVQLCCGCVTVCLRCLPHPHTHFHLAACRWFPTHSHSCKTTIDDIYTKLHRIESNQTGLSTEVLYRAIQEVSGGCAGAAL
jgi:hypothetical protein